MLQFGDISFDSILWFCLSGKSFFLGIAIIIFAVLLHFRIHRIQLLLPIYLLYILATLAILLSTTPLHPMFYVLWLTLFAGVQILRARHHKFAAHALLIFTAFTVFAALIELPWHRSPYISLKNNQQIYVIGDSVSAGIGSRDEITWPQLLEQTICVKVINLAKAGATVETALQKQAPDIENNSLIILEIGGNDLLNYTNPDDFRASADDLLKHLSTSEQVVWFELPLLPHFYRYGRIQRQLAKIYHVTLIPKSVLSAVFKTEGATSDGIHLTEKGHAVMAQTVASLFKTKQ
jgi:acyl-CoA thioesterase-1